VKAKGSGSIADKIIEIAKQHDIPLVKDKNLVQVLEALDLETEIPPELYRAVAEVLAFIYRLNNKEL
jgi:flagellar biosynthesis protein